MTLFRFGMYFGLPAALLFLGGCTAPQGPKPLYNYGTYSQDYYAYKKTLSEESLLKLQAAMEDAIAHADSGRAGRVPPGMYANLGYLYLKQGKPAEALQCFESEKRLYPESAHFMDRMIAKINGNEGGTRAE